MPQNAALCGNGLNKEVMVWTNLDGCPEGHLDRQTHQRTKQCCYNNNVSLHASRLDKKEIRKAWNQTWDLLSSSPVSNQVSHYGLGIWLYDLNICKYTSFSNVHVFCAYSCLTLSSIYTHFNTLKKNQIFRKTLWKKVKLPKMSNFTFFHNVFYAICISKSCNSHISLNFVVCSFYEFGMVSKWCIWEWVNSMPYNPNF